jgi:hypothetical protein
LGETKLRSLKTTFGFRRQNFLQDGQNRVCEESFFVFDEQDCALEKQMSVVAEQHLVCPKQNRIGLERDFFA